MHAVLRCAIFAASRMQEYPTVGNSTEKFKGCGLRVSELLRGPPTLR